MRPTHIMGGSSVLIKIYWLEMLMHLRHAYTAIHRLLFDQTTGHHCLAKLRHTINYNKDKRRYSESWNQELEIRWEPENRHSLTQSVTGSKQAMSGWSGPKNYKIEVVLMVSLAPLCLFWFSFAHWVMVQMMQIKAPEVSYCRPCSIGQRLKFCSPCFFSKTYLFQGFILLRCLLSV